MDVFEEEVVWRHNLTQALEQLVSHIDQHFKQLPPFVWTHVRSLRAICVRMLELFANDAPVSENQAVALTSLAGRLQQRVAELLNKSEPGTLEKRARSFPPNVDDFRVSAMHILFADLVELPHHVLNQTDVVDQRLTQLEQRPETFAEEMAGVLSEAKSMRAEALAEFADGRTALKAALAEAGVGKFAEHFTTLATEHTKEAKRWLSNAQASVVAAGVLVFVFLVNLGAGWWPPSLERSIAFGTLLCIIASVAVFCARNYRAHQHNEAVNKHRGVALQTFTAFRDSATDQATKEAILALAAQCAFTSQDTGFGGGIELVTPATHLARPKA